MDCVVEVVADEQISSEDAKTLEEWGKELFGEEETKFEWAPQHWHVLVRSDDRLASHVGITDHIISAGGEKIRVGGIGGVMTPMEFQGKGMAKAAMREAMNFMGEELGVEFGLLLCNDRLAPYYGRMKWHLIEAPLTFAQPDRQVTWDEKAMYLPYGEEPWPEGPVDLCGLPW